MWNKVIKLRTAVTLETTPVVQEPDRPVFDDPSDFPIIISTNEPEAPYGYISDIGIVKFLGHIRGASANAITVSNTRLLPLNDVSYFNDRTLSLTFLSRDGKVLSLPQCEFLVVFDVYSV